MEKVTMLGIDLAKESFQLHGVDRKGKAILRKSLKRKQLLEFMVQFPSCTVCMEACGGSNYWAQKFLAMGHQVKLIAAQYVKPFVKSQKNDRNDAEAIVEAASRPSMRFVSPKQQWQQDIQTLHRVRQRQQRAKTALACQIRGLLMEYGITIPEGIGHLKKQLPVILEDAENGLSSTLRTLVSDLYEEFVELEVRKAKYDLQLKQISLTHESCKRLQQVPGVGPLTSTAFVASVGDVNVFKNGRQLAAWLGLVPKQCSTGGKTKLLGITKRGDIYLRSLMVHGARAVVTQATLKKDRQDSLSQRIRHLVETRGFNKTAVAIANRNARVMFAMLKKGEDYRVG